MSDVEKRVKKYINDNLDHTNQFEKIASMANLQKRNKEGKVSFMKNKWLKIAIPCLIVAIVLVVSIVLITNNNKPTEQPKGEPVAVVQMDVNPSISLVIDENKVVLSCYGENDEGKMIVSGEEFVGKTLDQVVEKIIELETKTGYLVEGAKNNISYIIETDKEELLSELETKIKTKTAEVCEKYNIEEQVEVAKTKVLSSLVERALEIDPTLTKVEAEAMTSQELVKYIMGCQLEKATIPTVELENFYNSVKENRISFVEKEETKKLVDTLDSSYQTFKDSYAEMLTSLKEASDALDELYYNQFVSETSSYKKALDQVKEAKMELIKLKDEVSKLTPGSIEHSLKEAEIKAKETLMEGLELSLNSAHDAANLLIDSAKEALNTIITRMENAYNELPSEIKSSLNTQLTEVETKVNEVKDNSFKYFEENYKSDIEAALAKVNEYKASLVAQLK